MLARLGFVASVLSRNLSTSRTCRLRNATPERLRELALENLRALDEVVTFLDDEGIRLYRISSNVIPFASHAVNTARWWEEFAEPFERLARRLRDLDVRISTHPGQYTVLNSPNAAVVDAAVAELVYQTRLLTALGAGPSSKIVIHVGGLYGGGAAEAMDRFVAVAERLPRDVLQRLVVENDDRLFDADEALVVARRLKVPVVFDWLHHQANPTARPVGEVLAEVFDTWSRADGRPKVHVSSQAAGGPPGAHADFVRVEDMLSLLDVAPPVPFDCMLEAKQKDRAVLQLREELRARGIIERDAGQGAAGLAPAVSPRPMKPMKPMKTRSGRGG